MIIDIPTGGEPGVTLDRVHFEYDGRNILDGISWELDAGRNAVITGSSGCGKSTFLKLAAGLIPPTQGAVLMAGHPVAKLIPSERVRRGLRTGFIFQEGALFSNMDVFSNVSLALYFHQDVLELSEDAVVVRTEEALEATQISRAHWQTLPAHLSYGDRKRLALARAIAMRPNFLFFDDPDVGMDQKTARVTHQILCELRDDPRVTLLVATNRTTMIERLQIPGFRLEAGRLDENTRVSSRAPAFPEAPGLPTDI